MNCLYLRSDFLQQLWPKSRRSILTVVRADFLSWNVLSFDSSSLAPSNPSARRGVLAESCSTHLLQRFNAERIQTLLPRAGGHVAEPRCGRGTGRREMIW